MRLRLISKWPLLAIAFVVLVSIWLAMQSHGRGDPKELSAELSAALKQREWTRAERLLDRLSKLEFPRRELVARRAELEVNRGQPDRALEVLLAVPDGEPHAAGCRIVAGQIERSRDRVGAAEAHFLEALRLDGSQALARRELIMIYAMQARRAELNTQFRELARLESLKFDDVLLWTASLEDIWNNETIESDLRRYLAADPNDGPSRRALAAVLLKAGRLDEAEHQLEVLSSADTDGNLLRAQLAMARGDLGKVRALVEAGPRDHPGFAKIRGMLAIRGGKPETAVAEFRAALSRDPTDREATQGLATSLRLSGRGDEADALERRADRWRNLTDLLSRAKGQDARHDKVLLLRLGETCEALARVDEAIAWLRMVLDIDPLDETAQRSIFRLTNL